MGADDDTYIDVQLDFDSVEAAAFQRFGAVAGGSCHIGRSASVRPLTTQIARM